MKQEMIGFVSDIAIFVLKRDVKLPTNPDDGVAVASAGSYANHLHLTADRQHLITHQTGCSQPTVSEQ